AAERRRADDLAARLRDSRAEVARLTAQLAEQPAPAGAGAPVSTDEPGESGAASDQRARLLLDTVLDALTGLRRELALPPLTGTPGAEAEERLAQTTPAGAPGGGAAAIGPALLEQYLGLPRARLIVDGYNVTRGAWPSSTLEAQRARLLRDLAPVVARTRAETTVVFDAADADTRPPAATPRGVRVLFSPPGVIADDVVADLVDAEPRGRVVLVVSDDREVRDHATARGARPVPASALLGLLTR
ncbi:NYN domain-containing protein, partial [Nocardioides bruguierae]